MSTHERPAAARLPPAITQYSTGTPSKVKSTTRSTTNGPKNLFWIETEEGQYDRLVVAKNPESTEKYFCEHRHNELDEAYARLLIPIPRGMAAKLGWPTNALLEAIGDIYSEGRRHGACR